MPSPLEPIPTMPSGLRSALSRGALVPFVGAGASRLAGCPDWGAFAEQALKQFLGKGGFSYSQYEQIRSISPKLKLSLAKSLEGEHGSLDFAKILQPNGLKDKEGIRLYRALGQLSRVFVTTNFDEWLDTVIPPIGPGSPLPGAADDGAPPPPSRRHVIHRPAELELDLLTQEDVVIHLHGHLSSPSGLVMTVPDYLRHYANDRSQDAKSENRVLTFLDYLFRERTVLFVGYGLDELEILEYVLQKGSHPGLPEARHFVLQGFFSHEEQLHITLRRHFLTLGVEVIGFSRDQKDWFQLIDVLEAFAQNGSSSPASALQKKRDMKALLE